MTERMGNEKRAVIYDEYGRKQGAMDESYRAEYRKWYAGLTPEQRVELKDRGLDKPSVDRKAVGRGLEGVDLDRLGALDVLEGFEPVVESSRSDDVMHEALRIVRVALADIFNPAVGRTVEYEVDIVGISLGMPGLDSMTAVGKKHGVTKAAISKAAHKFCDDLGLPASSYMRSEANREVHRKTNRRRSKVS